MRILEEELTRLLGCKAEVTVCKHKRLGDFTSNVMMVHKLANSSAAVLETSQLIDSFSIDKGYLNFFVPSALIEMPDRPSVRTIDHRMKKLSSRLLEEGYTDLGIADRYWLFLAKALYLLNGTWERFGRVSEQEGQDLIKCFEDLDYTYVYRQQNKETLSYIQSLLTRCVWLLERISYE